MNGMWAMYGEGRLEMTVLLTGCHVSGPESVQIFFRLTFSGSGGRARHRAGVDGLGDHLGNCRGQRTHARFPISAHENARRAECFVFVRCECPCSTEESESFRRLQAESTAAAGHDVQYQLGVLPGFEL